MVQALVARRVRGLDDTIRAYLDSGEVEYVRRALHFATEAHEGQRRKSGEPYIVHPIQTAVYLADLRQDVSTIAAALLHDVVEDCNVTTEDLSKEFSPEIARLVDAVTKLTRVEATQDNPEQGKKLMTPERARSYTLRKMFIAMAQDLRVVLIKLADRLHNMKTLRFLTHEQQQKIAEETMGIYAPIAHRLGLSTIKWQLEDESFKYLMPARYKNISRMISRRRKEREIYTQKVYDSVSEAMQGVGIKCVVNSRSKHLYSIYKKIERYKALGKRVDEIYDLTAVRIITDEDNLEDCYRALEVIHGKWLPIPNQFDDYIANPKENMYQSLHTSVIGPDYRPLEVQIRTERMHRESEDGIAAHWAYKEGRPGKGNGTDVMFERALKDLKRMLIQNQEHVEEPEEYVSNVQTDYLSDQIFVLSPKGDVIELPMRSTPLDFAYKIHTQLGHNCKGAKVNGRMVALNSVLNNGDVIEVVAARKDQNPKLDWLNPQLGYLRSSSARSKVRSWFRKQERTKAVSMGQSILDREKKQLGIKNTGDEVASWFGYQAESELANALGSGQLTVDQFTHKIVPQVFKSPEVTTAPVQKETQKADASDIVVMNTKGVHLHIPKCCEDLNYGDPIVGYITRGRGISIHDTSCSNVAQAADADRLIVANWGRPTRSYRTTLELQVKDNLGIIRDISTTITQEKASIEQMSAQRASSELSSQYNSTIILTLNVSMPQQLARIIAKLKSIFGVVTLSARDSVE